jgi:hypothetical protein
MVYDISHYLSGSALVAKEAYKSTKVPYTTYYSHTVINACVAFFLLAIQCSTKEYPAYNTEQQDIARYGIDEQYSINDGYPLDTDSTNMKSIEGISYILLLTMTDDQIYRDYSIKRFEPIKQVTIIKNLVTDAVNKIIVYEVVQEALHKKRRYYESVEEEKEGLAEYIPMFFLPMVEESTVEQAENNNNVIVSEVANVHANSRMARMQLWIRSLNEKALETAMRQPGSTFLEITSNRKNISESYVEDDHEKRALAPKQICMLLTEFKPRKAEIGLIEPNEELYHRLFLKCCFRQSVESLEEKDENDDSVEPIPSQLTSLRYGHSHEPNVANKCMLCDFQFPGNPHVMDADIEGKQALEKDGVEITKQTFSSLLDQIHLLHRVASVEKPFITDVNEIVDELANEIPEWAEVVKNTFTLVNALDKSHNEIDQISATKEIASLCALKRNVLHQFITDKVHHTILSYITKLPWTSFCDVLQLYFITPFQRLRTSFSTEFEIPEEMSDLSSKHIDDITKILINELQFINDYSLSTMSLSGLTSKTKNQQKIVEERTTIINTTIQEYIDQLSLFLPYKNMIRFRNMVGKNVVMQYIQQLLLYGSLTMLVETSNAGVNQIMAHAIIAQLNKYNVEKMLSDPTEIKNRIESRNEKERNYVIKVFDKLSPEERTVELMNKRLGLGKWAIGGTKLIYAYDKDYYDLERQKRLDAGIVDFPGLGMENGVDGPAVDDMGFAIEGDQDGYDHNQHGDDDVE